MTRSLQEQVARILSQYQLSIRDIVLGGGSTGVVDHTHEYPAMNGEWKNSRLEEAAKIISIVEEELKREHEGAALPEPDWTDAPEWAQWWSCDACGACRWQEKEPRAINNTWISDGQFEIIRNTPDWRTTLQSRPEEDDD